MNSLIYSGIKNNLTESNELEAYQIGIQDVLAAKGITDPKIQDIKDALNDYLNSTTIKRACCLGNGRKVSVKIPVPLGYNLDDTVGNDLKKKFGFIEKIIEVPEELCKTISQKYPGLKDCEWKNGSPCCDTFMKSYCGNAIAMYKNDNGGNFVQSEWERYYPECTCYSPMSPEIARAVPAKCYFDNCKPGTGSYMDPYSRDSKTCDIVLCETKIDFKDISAGKDAVLNNKITQNCGKDSNSTAGPVPPAPPAPPVTSTNPVATQPIVQPTVQPAAPLLPSQLSLAKFQEEFNKIGCTKVLSDADIGWWKTLGSMDQVKSDMNAYYTFAKDCGGTQFQRDFCMPGKCKTDAAPVVTPVPTVQDKATTSTAVTPNTQDKPAATSTEPVKTTTDKPTVQTQEKSSSGNTLWYVLGGSGIASCLLLCCICIVCIVCFFLLRKKNKSYSGSDF